MPKSKIAKSGFWLSSLLLLTACKAEVLSPSGDIAAQQRDMLVTSTLLMLIIIVPVMLLVCWFAWHYRASNAAAVYKPNWDHSTKLELIIWAVPLLIIVSLGAVTWVGTHLVDPYRPLDRIAADRKLTGEEALKVQVVALDWKWLFIYPQYGVATVNQLALPVDRPVEFTLTSSSVMNAFYIPAMAGMIYAMPGMQTKLHGVFNREGTYQGLASHYSGAGFSGMRFKATAMKPDGFDGWIDATRAAGGNLDRATYLDLERPSENVKPATYAAVDPQLFPRVVNLCVEDGKICMAEMMALDRSGGTGLAGTINVAALTYDKHERRGLRAPVLGWEPFQVTGFCSTAEEQRMFGQMTAETAVKPRDLAPLRGWALRNPGAPMSAAPPHALSLAEPPAGAGSKL